MSMIWEESATVQLLCGEELRPDTLHGWRPIWSEHLWFFSRAEGCKSLQRSVEVNVRYSVVASTRVTVFRLLKAEHLHGQHASASSGEQTRITAVNTVLSSFPSSLFLYPLPRKRHLEAPAQVSRQLFQIQTPEYDQLLSSSGKGGNPSVPRVFMFPNMPEKVRVGGLYHTAWEELHKIPALKTVSSIF